MEHQTDSNGNPVHVWSRERPSPAAAVAVDPQTGDVSSASANIQVCEICGATFDPISGEITEAPARDTDEGIRETVAEPGGGRDLSDLPIREGDQIADDAVAFCATDSVRLEDGATIRAHVAAGHEVRYSAPGERGQTDRQIADRPTTDAGLAGDPDAPPPYEPPTP